MNISTDSKEEDYNIDNKILVENKELVFHRMNRYLER